MRINAGMILAVVIHSLITLNLFANSDLPAIGYLGMVVVIGNVIGMLLTFTDLKKAGYMTFIISSAILVPIGLIGAISARKELDKLKQEEFNKTLND